MCDSLCEKVKEVICLKKLAGSKIEVEELILMLLPYEEGVKKCDFREYYARHLMNENPKLPVNFWSKVWITFMGNGIEKANSKTLDPSGKLKPFIWERHENCEIWAVDRVQVQKWVEYHGNTKNLPGRPTSTNSNA